MSRSTQSQEVLATGQNDFQSTGKPAAGARPAKGRATRAEQAELEVSESNDASNRSGIKVTIQLGSATGVGEAACSTSGFAPGEAFVPSAQAVKQIKDIIAPIMKRSRVDLRQHRGLIELEESLLDRAGPGFSELGMNALLPVSRALWQVSSRLRSLDVCNYLRKYESDLCQQRRVQIFLGVLRGGAEYGADGKAKAIEEGRLAFRSIALVPVGATNYREALQMGERIDATLKDVLTANYGTDKVSRATDGGLQAVALTNNVRAISHVIEAIERTGYAPGHEVKLAIDVDASRFHDAQTGTYQLEGKTLDSEALIAYLMEIVDRFPNRILCIEDGLAQDDWESWNKLAEHLKKQDVLAVGDNLFACQLKRLRRGAANSSAHGVVIRPTQLGSLRAVIEVVQFAQEQGLQCLFAQGTGGCLDTSIADLAFATGALGLSAGGVQPESEYSDPNGWSSRKKYLRMVELEEARWYE